MSGDAFRVGITGHQGLTSATESSIRTSIADYLKSKTDPIGVTSLAEGADQIFAEQVVAAGGALEVVVPADHYEDSFQTDSARDNYRRLRTVSKAVIQLDFTKPSEDAYWAAGKKIAEECDELLAVWDGKPAVGHGGTGDVVDYARKIGKTVVIIWPDGASRR